MGLEHIERETHRVLTDGLAHDASSTKSRFSRGDVLYGRLRPNLNKVAIADFDGVCSTDILVFRPSPAILNKFLLAILSSHEFISYATHHARGVNLPRVPMKAISAFPLSLPPIQEQALIVARLDALTPSVSALRRKLEGVMQTAWDYERAILFVSTNESLWQEQRSRHRDGEHPRDRPRVVGQWSYPTVAEVGDVRLGRQRSPQHHDGDNMRPYLRVANVLEDRIDVSDVMEMNFDLKEYETYELRHGDVLLNEGQSLELVGRPALYRNEIPGACYTNTLIRFRASDQVDPEFALLVFRAYLHSGRFRKVAKVSTNLAHLGAARFADMPFPLPPRSQQQEIVDGYKKNKSVLEAVVGTASRVLSDAETLWQAVIAEAIRGTLVPQNAAHGSASDQLLQVNLDRASYKLRTAQQRLLKPKQKGRSMRKMVSIVEALQGTGGPLSSQRLFSACGYPDDAPTEQVELFFLDVREALRSAVIRRERQGDDDVFTLVGEKR